MKSILERSVEVLEQLSRLAHPGVSVSRPLLSYESEDGKRRPMPPGKPVIVFRVTALTPNPKKMYVCCQFSICEEEVLLNTPEGLLDLAKHRVENAVYDCLDFAEREAETPAQPERPPRTS